MSTIIINLISDILSSFLEYVDVTINALMQMALNFEDNMILLFGSDIFANMFDIIYIFGISLIIFKFLKKGIDKYIFEIDGDAETDVFVLVSGFFKAIVTACSFYYLYDWSVQLVTDLTNDLLSSMNGETNGLALLIAQAETGGIFLVTMIFVFFICYFMLYIQFIQRGLEILILRIGFPITCVGLMDKDGGVFRTYLQKIIQSLIGVMIQLVLLKLSLVLATRVQIILAIATMMLAIRTPKFIQEFIIVGDRGSGGVMSKAYYSSMVVKSMKSFVK